MSVTDNPFTVLEQAAQRQVVEEQALTALTQARCKLVLDKDAQAAFFATLALRLVPEADWNIQTAATDGRVLKYNPGWLSSLPKPHVLGVLCHEVMHNALAHPLRMQAPRYEPKKANIACDLAINPLLLEAGFRLPEGCLLPGKGQYHDLPSGLSAEQYYPLLPDDPEGGNGDGDGDGDIGCPDPGKCGGTMPPTPNDPATLKQRETEGQIEVSQARERARQRGQLPAGLARLVEEVLQPKVDWKEVLREFVSRHAKNDYAWWPPNRRFIWQGLYLPGLRSEELGDIVLAVDTSGSIGQQELAVFSSEVQGILDSFDCSLTILYHDNQIQNVQQWASNDGPLILQAKGGGGTSHRPVFDWVAQQGEQPTCMVCLTDLYTEFPSKSPGYPVLWAVVGSERDKVPFGQVVQVQP